MLNVLIVDDEAPAHDVMLHHIGAHEDLTVVGQCYNAAETLTSLETLEVDLMLLDIRMPGFGGLDLLRGLKSPPLTIIASAHRDYAVDGFDLDVVDYLLKPVSAERFAGALDKVRRRLDEQSQRGEEAITLKVDRAMRRVDLADIAFIQAQHQSALVILALRLKRNLRRQAKITRDILQQTMPVIIAKAIMSPLPKVCARLCPNFQTLMNLKFARLIKPVQFIR